MKDNYHHGNLREALIEAGLKLINVEGEANLSLRKVASLCDVSHAAPYAHFKDKEELIEAIKASVTNKFMVELNKAINKAKSAEEAILNMGKSYIIFFINNPDYSSDIYFSQSYFEHSSYEYDPHLATASLCLAISTYNDYPPFILLKNEYLKYLKEKNMERNEEEKEIDIIKIWSTVHGLASLACQPNVEVSFNWIEMLEKNILLK